MSPNYNYSDSTLNNMYLLGRESYVDPNSEIMFKANWTYENEKEKTGRKTLEIYYQLPN